MPLAEAESGRGSALENDCFETSHSVARRFSSGMYCIHTCVLVCHIGEEYVSFWCNPSNARVEEAP